jgi:NADPH-dependent 2,4-dienoyl-CoA reductase/sulfur reductase-like enzyme
MIGLSALVDPTYQRSIDLAYYLMVLGLITLRGPGALSIDNLVVRAVVRRFPSLRGIRVVSYEGMPRVVIIGGGFGGIAAAKALRQTSCQVTLIDRRNYFLFQPLLYQVATAGLSPADIAGPIRALFRDQPNVRVMLGEVTDVAAAMREVILPDARVAYDYLVVATGALRENGPFSVKAYHFKSNQRFLGAALFRSDGAAQYKGSSVKESITTLAA